MTATKSHYYYFEFILTSYLIVAAVGSSGKSRSQKEIKATYPITVKMILLLLCNTTTTTLLFVVVVSCHRLFLHGTSLEPTVIPTTQA